MSDEVNARMGIYGGFGSSGQLDESTDRFEDLQQPEVNAGSDPLASFVMRRVVELELEPRGEVIAAYDKPAGPMAHRYAKHVRRDCVVFRKQVAQYLVIKAEYEQATDEGERQILSGCVLAAAGALSAIAERWDDHPEFQPDWSME